MSQTRATQFIAQVSQEGLKVVNQPDIIWLFGSGAEEILDIKACASDSRRAKFYKWLFEKGNPKASLYKTPEHYPEWIRIDNGYSNLVDLELDLVSIAQATVIFSESEGTFAELGVLSCQHQELLKSLVVVVDNKHLNTRSEHDILKKNSSFINYGPLEKIRLSYEDEDDAPIYGFDERCENTQFVEIINKIESVVKENRAQKFNLNSKKHRFFLLLDVIHLLGSSKKIELQMVLNHFGVELEIKELTQMLKLLMLIDLVEKRNSHNPLYQLHDSKNHKSLIDFTGIEKKFDRQNFLLNTGA